jgi:hypoxanthine-DNA glycosylase
MNAWVENIRSIHPYEPYIPEAASKLIIGSIPPYRFCVKPQNLLLGDVNFYYGSHDNLFWELIPEARNSDFGDSIEKRKEFLKNNNFGITDMIQSCVHEGQKSTDEDLKDIELKPIKDLLVEHPNIKLLFYTSTFVKKLINKISDDNYHNSVDESSRKWSVRINERTYNVTILYSPSPRVCAKEHLENRRKQYNKYFGNLAKTGSKNAK